MGCSEGDVIDANHNYCGITNASTNQLTDEDLALEEGLRRMSLAVASGRPWWVSIGVHRPHTVYRVPPGFYGPEVYPTSGDAVLPPQYPRPPVNVPFMSGNWEGGDINDAAHGCPDCIVPANRSVEYRRWYYAAVTWADHSLGRALQHLQDMGPAVVANTIVVFHSDHGYQLGELNEVGGGMCCSPLSPFWRHHTRDPHTNFTRVCLPVSSSTLHMSTNSTPPQDGNANANAILCWLWLCFVGHPRS